MGHAAPMPSDGPGRAGAGPQQAGGLRAPSRTWGDPRECRQETPRAARCKLPAPGAVRAPTAEAALLRGTPTPPRPQAGVLSIPRGLPAPTGGRLSSPQAPGQLATRRGMGRRKAATSGCWPALGPLMLQGGCHPHLLNARSLSHVWLFATPWTVAHQAPPSVGFSRQEYWSGLPSPSPTSS